MASDSEQQIVLFDLPSKPPNKAWSLNPWKTRMLLNYKGLNYRTEWIEYPDIRPRLEGHVEPNSTNLPYTIPTIILPSGEYVMNSRTIADRIEALYPSPPVHLDSPQLAKLEELMRQLMPILMAAFCGPAMRNVVTEASLPYWKRTRAAAFGMPVEEFEAKFGGEPCWQKAEPPLAELTALLTEKKAEGPFFMGKEVSYADFVWVGFLIFCQKVGEGTYEKLLERSGDAEAHAKLMEAAKPWCERDDY
ncbi:hypothetical protein VTK26DRAFT_2405 [Humicola hyalothermophila]